MEKVIRVLVYQGSPKWIDRGLNNRYVKGRLSTPSGSIVETFLGSQEEYLGLEPPDVVAADAVQHGTAIELLDELQDWFMRLPYKAPEVVWQEARYFMEQIEGLLHDTHR